MKKRNISVTKIFTFDSAHRLNDYVGKCAEIHGHTYKLELTLRGFTDDKGLVIDFHDVEKLVNEQIMEKIDHKLLNDVFDFNPTCENIALWIWDEAEKIFCNTSANIEKVILWENAESCITIKKEDMQDFL